MGGPDQAESRPKFAGLRIKGRLPFLGDDGDTISIIGLGMRVYVRSRQCAEEADCGFDACGFLELDECCARESAKSRRLVAQRACTA